MKIVSYHILKGICDDLKIELQPLAGATENHTTFKMSKKIWTWNWAPNKKTKQKEVYAHGWCSNGKIRIGTGRSSEDFDLCDPNSIEKIVRYIKSGKCWR